MKDSAASAKARGKRKVQIGRVASDKMDKTIKVVVERRMPHPVYGKFVTRYTTIMAHDPDGQAAEGDTVEVMETRPVSKTKRWRLVRVVKKVQQV